MRRSSSKNSASTKFASGDRVIHAKRPEWGPGTIVGIENSNDEGQRLQIRFSAAGLKVINTAFAPLKKKTERTRYNLMDDDDNNGDAVDDVGVESTSGNGQTSKSENGQSTVATRPVHPTPVVPRITSTNPANASRAESNGSGSGWLASLEERDPEAMMLKIPDAASDPFCSVWARLESSLDLYRFTSSPHSLTDWSIAQSGLADPLTQFNRQELETLFMRWTRIRNAHLFTILEEADREDAARAKAMLAQAPNIAQQAMRQAYARR